MKNQKKINKRFLDLIRLTKTTILYLHHHRKKMVGENNSQGSARGSTEIIAKVASHLLLDSKKEVDETGRMVLKMTIEQFKSRRPDGINKIGLNVMYNPETKKSTFEYLGEIDEKSQSLHAAKESLGSFMQLGTEYALRHTFASHLAQNGVSIVLIKELLGHADIKTTMRYSHLTTSVMQGAINTLNENVGHNMATITIAEDKKLPVAITSRPRVMLKAQ